MPWSINDAPTNFNYDSNVPPDWTSNQYRATHAFVSPLPTQSRYSSHSEVRVSGGAAKSSRVTSVPEPAPSAEFFPDVRVDKATLIERICEINKQLYRHATTLPPDPSPHSSAPGTTRSSSAVTSPQTHESLDSIGDESANIRSQATSSHNEREFAIDETFSLSHELIGVLNQIYPRFTHRYPDLGMPSHQPSTTSSPSMTQHSSAQSTLSVTCPPYSLDEGSVLLILSSYLRVINIYDTIFSHIQNSISATNGREWKTSMRLPRLNIGAFSLPSCSVMEITVIIQLAEQLLSQLREITGLMDTNTRHEDHDTDGSHGQGQTVTGITDATLRSLRSREKEMMKRTTQVKRSLLQLNIL